MSGVQAQTRVQFIKTELGKILKKFGGGLVQVRPFAYVSMLL